MEADNNSSRSSWSSTRISSHHHSTPTPSNEQTSWPRHRQISSKPHHFLLLLLLLSSCFVSIASAAKIYLTDEMVEVRGANEPESSKDLGSTFHRLAKTGTILVDQSPPPVAAPAPADWVLATLPDDLQRRDVPLDHRGEDAAAATTLSTSTVKSSQTAAVASSSTTSSAASETTSALPVPFDVGFQSNITTGCASFMNDMLSNSTFKTCLPFSLLLQNSNSFFQAEKSLVRITQTLDYSCAANVTTCSRLMSAFASNITSTSTCADDITKENPLILQAKAGLLAYTPLYTASCLHDPSTSSYCFAEAVTNASNPADTYIYFLPLNQSLPGGSQPTCDACLKTTMAVFEQGTSDRSSALTSTYVSAAMQVNVNCGPNFVNASLAAAVVTSSSTAVATPITGMGLGILVLVSWVAGWLL